MRTFITEMRPVSPPPRQGRVTAFVFRWTTTLFALASLVLDARLAFGYGADETGYSVLLRTLLIEIEVYLAVVVVIMTVRIILQRGEQKSRRPRRG